MIEVEKKFILKPKDTARLIKGSDFLNEKTFTDIYYDSADFALTTKDMWLRQRDGRFELKFPLNESDSVRVLDQYEEYETEEEISRILNFSYPGDFNKNLQIHKYQPFVTLVTTRKKYKKGEFIIDLDIIDFGYSIGEIELMVNDKSQIQAASDKIIVFAKENDLELTAVRGKVVEYLRRNNPEHHQALVSAGVVYTD